MKPEDLKNVIDDLILAKLKKDKDGNILSSASHFNRALCKLLQLYPDYKPKNPEYQEVIDFINHV